MTSKRWGLVLRLVYSDRTGLASAASELKLNSARLGIFECEITVEAEYLVFGLFVVPQNFGQFLLKTVQSCLEKTFTCFIAALEARRKSL